MNSEKRVSYIDKSGNIRQKEVKKLDKENKDFDYTRYLNIGFYLVTPLLLGVFLGLKLDDIFHSKPFLTILLIILGAVGTFYNLIKLTKDA